MEVIRSTKKMCFIFLINFLFLKFFSLTGEVADEWRVARVNVNPGAEFYFIIEGNFFSSKKIII